MGITGLLPFVKNSCRLANIKDFSGTSVAVDAYSWLHKGAFSCAEKLVKGEKTDGYVFYCMKQLNLLLEAGLKPVMVFDGCNLSSKEGTEKKRRENREKTRQRGKELLCEGKIKEARECFQRCVDVTPEMAKEVIEACKRKHVDCIVAPYEADAQLAYLNKIGMVQLIITEDSDLILFGCTNIFFKMDNCGGGLLYEKENLAKSFGTKASKFCFEKFRYMCILSGCDYLQSLPGIGLGKACKFFTLTNNLDITNVLPKIPSYLKMPRLTVPPEYIDSFIKANNTFLYQLVFCPQKKALVPLNPYPDDIKPEDVEYAGQYLPNDLACQLAMGNINVKTMEEFDAFSANSSPVINEDKSIVWGSQSSSSSRAKNKIELSAFKYSTPKQKKYVSKKRQFAEMADCGGEATCTDEELFSMYGNADAKRNHIENASSEEDPLAEEGSSLDSSVVSSEANAFQSSPHPKILNLPFRKIVRSRFFAAETTPDVDSTLADCISLSEESKIENDSFVSNCNVTESLETDSENIAEDANSPLKLENSSPKRDNKENIAHRFAKKNKLDVKQSLVSSDDCDINSQEDKLKSDSWLNIIDEECSATTSTISSTGKSNKLLDIKCDTSKPECNISSSHKKIPKKFITTKIQDFKWTKGKVSEVKFNSSLGSDGNSFSESLEESFITENVERTSTESIVSPYFNSSAILNNNVDSESGVILPNESEELNTFKMEVEHSPSIPKNQLNKSLNTLKTKSKPGRCRTLGLSKNRKNSDKVSRKETLLNFNFVRQPKKEGPVVL
ncbi:exonuclease 1 [Trichonephila inaurata madagascariensis]|uniref:Exonuclease 1 n=1 Tax=Trichonephila inaurata madagascariensis TaxID=2747483 RepID=A0A8X6YP39_9ARAC|nr:exonuclease 1 [Trichonephila inaurata madagascariensis]